MSNSRAATACRGALLMIIGGLAAALLTGCHPPAGDEEGVVCAHFDTAYDGWHHSARGNAVFIDRLDQAATDAGGTELGGALQAVAANVRALPKGAKTSAQLDEAIALVRKSCPAH